MTIASQRETDLPPAAWFAQWDVSKPDSCVVTAGVAVELGADGWVEGVWAGPFAEGRFDCTYLAGSGAKITAEGVTLYPAFHTYSCIWLTHQGNNYFASNSLAFLLARSRISLDPCIPDYPQRLVQVLNGGPLKDIGIPTLGGAEVSALFVTPKIITWGGGTKSLEATDPVSFCSFEVYRQELSDVARAMVANAQAKGRRIPLCPVVSVSSGYDSAAVAVIAQEAGARRAMTITDEDASDSGLEVCVSLGLKMESFARDVTPIRHETPVVAEFWATGFAAMDLPMLAAESALSNSLLFTGNHGDKMWERRTRVTTDYLRGDAGGNSLSEFLLRRNVVHLPLPFIGARNQGRLHEISNSPEMAPWSIRESYDRPIPRRIAETAGVNRESFGVRKRAVVATADMAFIRSRSLRRLIRSDFRARRSHILCVTPHWMEYVRSDVMRVRRILRRIPKWLASSFGLYLHRGRTRHVASSIPTGDVIFWSAHDKDYLPAMSLHGLWGSRAFLWAVSETAETRYAPSSPHP